MLKKRIIGNIFIICTLILLNVSSVFSHDLKNSALIDPIDYIRADRNSGKISKDSAAVLVVDAIKNPDKLPVELREKYIDNKAVNPRSATPAIIEIYTYWDQLLPSTQSYLSTQMARPAGSLTYVSPSGFFVMHYDTTGPDAVSPIDVNSNSVPDFVEKCASYCDTSLQYHIDLGYLLPPSDGGLGGDTLFDVYFEEMPFFGYAVPEGPGSQPWNDAYSYLVLHRDFIGFSINDDPEGHVAGAAKATAAHEFHHCVQFAYDPNEPIWFMELDATYFEDIAFDQVNDNVNYLSALMNVPEKSLMATDLHMYASFPWGMYLAQKFDTSLMVALWDGSRFDPLFNTLSDTLMGRYGWTQDSAFADYFSWLYFTSNRDDGLHFEEASDYPLVLIRHFHSNYPQNNKIPSTLPKAYAGSFIEFKPGSEVGNLRVTFDGDQTHDWAGYLIISNSDTEHTTLKFELDANNDGTLSVYGFDTLQSVTLVGVNLEQFGDSGTFTYTAEIFGNYAVTTQLITTDSLVYVGAPRDFVYRIHNPSPLNDVYDIITWDDSGWVSSDTTDVFIPLQDSVDVLIPVTATLGSAIGSKSNLNFKAVSKNDGSIFDEQSGLAKTVLQIGDVTFDGLIDIGDVTYVVSFLFLAGPEPLPVMESGNFDCVGDVDIADLTAMISYLFITGTPSACNPF